MPVRVKSRSSSKGASSKGGASKPFGKKSKTAVGFDPDDDEVREMLPSGLGHAFSLSMLDSAKKQLKDHGLQAPEEYDGDWPELPDDIDATDYSELSNLMIRFQNALATTVWQQSYHYIWSNTFEELAGYVEALATVNAEGTNDTQRKANARLDDKVVFFRARRLEHYNSYVRFRDLAHTLERKIKAVSRVLGFKDEDEEATDLSALKKRGSSRRSRNK